MTTLVAAIILIGIIVFIHELGHYLAARSIGVKVERFSVGFPPRLMTFTSIPDGWEFRLFFYKSTQNNLCFFLTICKFLSRGLQDRSSLETSNALHNLPSSSFLNFVELSYFAY